MIPYGRQDVTQEDIDAVVDVMKSSFLTQGPEVERFEKAFADVVSARYAVASNSATSSLHLAYLALDVGPGDRVWMSPITFVATANAARMCGADVGFVDVDPDTQCMDIDALQQKLEAAQQSGMLPKLVVPVHFTGRACDMAAIAELGKEFGFRIVEDAAHAVGASYQSSPVGACEFSDIAVFSFHPVKIVTTAEGGMATTNDPELASRMATLRTHGVTRDPTAIKSPSPGDWYYEQHELGFNYRMTDMQAALGRSQLTRLSGYIQRRRDIARRYDKMLADLPINRPPIDSNDLSAWHLYIVRLNDDAPPRAEVFAELRKRGIGVQIHYIPVHTQPYYKELGFAAGDMPVAEDYYERAISLPMFPTLSDVDQDTVVETLRDILDQ